MYTAHVHFFTNLDLFCTGNARIMYWKIRYKMQCHKNHYDLYNLLDFTNLKYIYIYTFHFEFWGWSVWLKHVSCIDKTSKIFCVNCNLKCFLLFNLYRLSPTQSKHRNQHSFFKHMTHNSRRHVLQCRVHENIKKTLTGEHKHCTYFWQTDKLWQKNILTLLTNNVLKVMLQNTGTLFYQMKGVSHLPLPFHSTCGRLAEWAMLIWQVSQQEITNNIW